MKKHRLTALALMCALTLATVLPAAWAAAQPSLSYTQSGSTVQLTLRDLDGESVYGVQLELMLAGEHTSATFTPSAATAYAPPCYRATSGDSTLVTIYLTDRTPLNSGKTLTLGSLTLSTTFTMPAAATVTLLNRDLQPMADRLAVAVSRQSVSTGVNSGGGGGGGYSNPNQTAQPSPTPDVTPEPTETPAPAGMSFVDVEPDDWFYNEVKYVYDRGMMNGTGDGAFSPNEPTSRAMIVTILYRLAGSPDALAPSFPDVPDGQYYTAAVGWAAQHGIVTGYDTGLFQPDGRLTREQLAAILYRYSQAMGYSTARRGSLTQFDDYADVSPYAWEPMSWAVGVELLSGMGDGTVAPTGQATRAQVATILARYCKNVAKIKN